jgi:hypothetical protein
MANVIILKPGEAAPESGDRILIARDAKTRTFTISSRLGDVTEFDPDYLPLDQALARAQKEAETSGIETIYIQEVKLHS